MDLPMAGGLSFKGSQMLLLVQTLPFFVHAGPVRLFAVDEAELLANGDLPSSRACE
jgi:hypothetical protein